MGILWNRVFSDINILLPSWCFGKSSFIIHVKGQIEVNFIKNVMIRSADIYWIFKMYNHESIMHELKFFWILLSLWQIPLVYIILFILSQKLFPPFQTIRFFLDQCIHDYFYSSM